MSEKPGATAVIATLVLAACALNPPPPSPPPPRELEVAQPPDAMLAAAGDLLRALGWTVAQRQATSLLAEHTAAGDANGDWMVCENGVGRRGDRRRATRDLRSTVAVSVRASPSPAGSAVWIRAAVLQSYSLLGFPDRGPPEYTFPRCVSSGAIERLLADSLAAPRRPPTPVTTRVLKWTGVRNNIHAAFSPSSARTHIGIHSRRAGTLCHELTRGVSSVRSLPRS